MSTDSEYLPHFNGKVNEIRAMGYNLLYAVQEPTDNSVSPTCASTKVRIVLQELHDRRLNRISVIDNGTGMTFQQLREAIIFNLVKRRENGDIGAYHVGMKYALIALGSQCVILSRKSNGTMVGVYLDFDQMVQLNSYRPTDICENVDDTWALRYVTPSLFEQFKCSPSGTYIEVKNLVSSCRQPFKKAADDLAKGFSTAYANLHTRCSLTVETISNIMYTITPVDMFYRENSELLDETPYNTVLLIYRGVDDDVRIIEMIQQSRKQPGSTKKMIEATPAKPVYYEHFESDPSIKGKQITMKLITVLPSIDDLIDRIAVRVIQVNRHAFSNEKNYFPEDSKLWGDRKGYWFFRDGIRCVGSAKHLKKIYDRTTNAAERQRTQVVFPSQLDRLVGSKFNKQMEEGALPCAALNQAVLNIFKQVTAPWIKVWGEKEKKEKKEKKAEQESSDEVSDSDDHEEEEQQPAVELVDNEHAAKEPASEVSASEVSASEVSASEVSVVEVSVAAPVVEVPVAEPDAEVPASEEPNAEEVDAEVPVVEEPAAKEPASDDVEESASNEDVSDEDAAEEPEVNELTEEQMPQFDEEVPEFEQPLVPRKNVVTFDLTHFTNEQYEHFKEMAEIFGLII